MKIKVLFLDFDGVLNSGQSGLMSYRIHQQNKFFKIRHWIWNYIMYLLNLLPERFGQSEPMYEIRIWVKAVLLDYGQFCPIACSNLAYLLEKEPNLRIVVSSVWRLSGLRFVQFVLRRNGINPKRVIDITPRNGEYPDGSAVVNNRVRGHQIQAWLNVHKPDVESFCIVDDDSDMAHLLPYLVKTRSDEGLMWRQTVDVAERLSINLR